MPIARPVARLESPGQGLHRVLSRESYASPSSTRSSAQERVSPARREVALPPEARCGSPLRTSLGAMIFYRLGGDVRSDTPAYCYPGAMILSGKTQTYTPVPPCLPARSLDLS